MGVVRPPLRQGSLGVFRGRTAELAGADDPATRAGTGAGVLGIDPDRPARACGPGDLACRAAHIPVCAVRAVAESSTPARGLGFQLHDLAPGRVPAADGLTLHPGRSVHRLLVPGAITLRELLWHRPCADRRVALGRGTAVG